MARPREGDKLSDIRRATVDEVAENGSATVSINKIAARAGLSVGTLYRYHATKEAMLRSVYLGVKRDIHDALMNAAETGDTSKKRIRAMWFALLAYACDAPNDFLFSELMHGGTILTPDDAATLDAMVDDIMGVLQAALDDGTLRPVPLKVVELMLTAPAFQMARRSVLRAVPVDLDLAEQAFAIVWDSLAQSA